MNKLLLLPIWLSFVLCGCSNAMPREVYSHEVAENSEGYLCYKDKPFTGKVIGKNKGYMQVNKGFITNLIICHSNGSTAINVNLVNTTMLFKDENGLQITKGKFLSKYPSFRSVTDWELVK